MRKFIGLFLVCFFISTTPSNVYTDDIVAEDIFSEMGIIANLDGSMRTYTIERLGIFTDDGFQGYKDLTIFRSSHIRVANFIIQRPHVRVAYGTEVNLTETGIKILAEAVADLMHTGHFVDLCDRFIDALQSAGFYDTFKDIMWRGVNRYLSGLDS